MQIFIDNAIDCHRIKAIKDLLGQNDVFEAGSMTAAGMAKQVKNNEQSQSQHPIVKGALEQIEQALWAHPVFQAAALPKRFARLMFSRYSEDMAYGAHIDNAFIDGARADLSFTLFLTEPSSYQGGELVLHHHHGDEPIKLEQGSLVLYPSTRLHQVTAVTEGERLVVVGWLESRVRSAEQREVLFDLSWSINQLGDTTEQQAVKQQLVKTRENLLRQWAD